MDRPALDILNFLGPDSMSSGKAPGESSDLVTTTLSEMPRERRFNRNSFKQMSNENECSFLDSSIVDSVNSMVNLQEQRQKQDQEELNQLNLSSQSNDFM